MTMLGANDRVAVRERLHGVIQDNRPVVKRSELLAIGSDLEWALDEIDRLQDKLDKATGGAKPRKAG